jgi:uncharacterized integral membrane protein (TIGR00698 family)
MTVRADASTAAGLRRLLPGLVLTGSLGLLAYLSQQAAAALIGPGLLEGIVLAILFGVVVRNVVGVRPDWQPGIDFSAKPVLETAVLLLGAGINIPIVLAAGPAVLATIALAVIIALIAGYGIGRLLGLNQRFALLVAAGNAICGNSAIAAVSPVINARKEETAGAIAFNAVLGIAVVLLLPLGKDLLAFNDYQYGMLAGLTVYAVPTVLAATLPVSAQSAEVATLIKLIRTLFLGPLVLVSGLVMRDAKQVRPSFSKLVPWFVIGFMLLAALRSLGWLPAELAAPLREASRWLSIIAMAGLGMGVDLRGLQAVGLRVGTSAALSLLVIFTVTITLIRMLAIG